MRKLLISVSWVLLIIFPSFAGFLYLKTMAPKPTAWHGHVGSWRRAISPDGLTRASCGPGNGFTILDVPTGRTYAKHDAHQDWVRQIVFSPDGRLIATASGDTTVKLWGVADGEEIRTLRGHRKEVSGVQFTPDGKTIISAGGDGIINLWDIDGGEIRLSFRAHESDWGVWDLTLSPDGKTLATTSKHELKLWGFDGEKGSIPLRVPHCPLAFSSDSKLLAAFGQWADGTEALLVWDLETGKYRALDPPTSKSASESYRAHTRLQMSPDEKRLVLISEIKDCNTWDSTQYVCRSIVEIWDLASGQKTAILGRGRHQIFPPSANVFYWLRESDEPRIESVLYDADGKPTNIITGHFGEDLETWPLDFESAERYQYVSLLVASSTLVIAARAIFYWWFRAGLNWRFRCTLTLATLAGLMFLGWYLLGFWVDSFADGAMPIDRAPFQCKYWIRGVVILGTLMTGQALFGKCIRVGLLGAIQNGRLGGTVVHAKRE